MCSDFLPVYKPDLSGNERAYVIDCIDSSWISSNGEYIEKFEKSFAEWTGAKHAISVCNGSVALHLALHCLDIGPGDEVIVPTFTYIASVNTIAQTGAKPVFAESNKSDWLIDIDKVEELITDKTRAILPVHLYGYSCDTKALRVIANKYGLKIIEDCAEAIGTKINTQHIGLTGEIGSFSFFGNKTITTGEGGMVVTNDEALASRLRQVKGQGQSFSRRYWHEMLGFNYRMTNIEAAIGLAQMERIDSILVRKRRIGESYKSFAAHLPVSFQNTGQHVESSYWLTTILLPENINRDELMFYMRNAGIETRPTFYCAHTMPMYDNSESFPVAQDISKRGLSLPSYPALTENDILRVVETLASGLEAQHATL